MHMAKSLKEKITSYFHTTKIQKICISMHLDFNIQFIKITRTRPIFQKTNKKIFCFFLISGITDLYVKRTPDIKKVVFFIWR